MDKHFLNQESGDDNRPYWKVLVSLVFSLIATVLLVWLGIKGLFFFMPFVVGWFISFIANPLVSWLERKLKIVRKLGSAIIIIMVLAVIIFGGYFAISALISETASLIQNIPDLYAELETSLRDAGERLNGIFEVLPKGIQNALSAVADDFDTRVGSIISDLSQPTVNAAGNIAKSIPSILISTIVMIVSSYFFIAYREDVISWCKKVAPQAIQHRMTMIIENLKYAIGGYIKAQLKIMLVVGVILWIGLLILKVDYSVLLALLIAFLDFLPFFGTGTALIPWAAFDLYTGDVKQAVGLLVLYVITQLVRQVIQPKLVGDSMGMNPLVTLILIYAGYKIGSIMGMILSVPIGMLVINLNKAGAFDYIVEDVKTLAVKIIHLRQRE